MEKMFYGMPEVIEIEGNTGEGFQQRLKEHFGGTFVAAANEYSGYTNKLEACAKIAGMLPDEFHGKTQQKILEQGHVWEGHVLDKNAQLFELYQLGSKFVKIDAGNRFEIEIERQDQRAFKNKAWPDAEMHLDAIMKVKKGKVIPNPDFYIGSGKQNWVITPDAEDHIYVVDAKTCQSEFVPAWNDKNDEGVAVGGLKNGACPDAYWAQLQAYMGTCHIDGGFIFADIGRNDVNEYAQVFVPYEADKAKQLLDNAQRLFSLAKSGRLPRVSECKNPEAAALTLEKIFPTVNEHLKMKKLKDKKWAENFEAIRAINKEIDNLKKSVSEEQQKVNTVNAQIKRLRDQRKAYLLEPLEEAKDRKGYYYTDEYGNTSVAEVVDDASWNFLTKEFIAQEAPDLYEEILKRFGTKDVKYAFHEAVQQEAESE